MMRRVLVLMLSALSVGAFSSCQQPVMGSMSRASVDDLLGAERFAVTPCTPGWMLEKSDIFELGADEAAQLRALLSRAPLNEVSEEAYRTSDACALGKTSDRRFYLYASNAQCMEAHLVDDIAHAVDIHDTFGGGERHGRALFQGFFHQFKQFVHVHGVPSLS